MKFTDGNWMMQPGAKAFYAAQAYDVEDADGALTIYATKHINHRGDTLEGPLLTITLSSPMADVVRVRIEHFAGVDDRPPRFDVYEDGTVAQVVAEEDFAELTAGNLTARVSRKGWGIDFIAGGKRLTGSGQRGIGYIDLGGEKFLHEQLSLGVGECVYGLGERFTSFVKNGQVVEMWNKDGGTGSEQAYKNIPFYLTNRGYGVFVADSGPVSFEVASEQVSRVQFSVPGESLEYFIIYGPTPKEVLSKYTALTGRPALPPAWSFGLWLTTSFTTNYDEKTVTDVLAEFEKRDLPLHVFHFDCFWMREFHWCDFEWDPRTFPNPAAMLKRLKDRGLRICVWINPYIAQRSKLFEEGKRGGYFLLKASAPHSLTGEGSGGRGGDVWQTDQWQAGMAIVDFTNPDACAWYASKLKALLDMGVDCFKTDFGERIPTDVVYHDGSDPVRMHNYYTQLYNKTVFDVLLRERGVGEATLFARSATAGGQQFPVHWGGDCYSSFESMAESLRGGLSLCLSGFGFWSHDIGGFEGMPPAAIYKRWIAFGLLSSHSRLHGSSSYRAPWLFDEEAVDVLRHFTKLKCRLMPYLFAKACEAHETGVPMMRAMLLEFPGDPAVDNLDRQYLLGDSLLTAPVFSAENTVDYYVPAGTWTDFETGRIVEGGRWVREEHNFLSSPLLVRPGSIIPVGAVDNRPDYDYADGVTLRIYQPVDGRTASASFHTVKGEIAATVTARRDDRSIKIDIDGTLRNWKALLVGFDAAASVEGGTASSEALGLLISPKDGARSIIITL